MIKVSKTVVVILMAVIRLDGWILLAGVAWSFAHFGHIRNIRAVYV